jgi:hypothetical protein
MEKGMELVMSLRNDFGMGMAYRASFSYWGRIENFLKRKMEYFRN